MFGQVVSSVYLTVNITMFKKKTSATELEYDGTTFLCPIKVVQFVFLLSLFCKKTRKLGDTDLNAGLYGNAAELSCGSQLSSVTTTSSQPTKRSAITAVDNNTKAIAILRLTRDLLVVNLLILCGDIAQNPEPGGALHGKGLKVCHWNV